MKRALILVVPLALTLVACSGDDDPEIMVPDVTLPDVTVPDISLPDISLPDISLPDISLPDISLPDISLPDISLPDLDNISIPDLSIPENAGEMIGQMFPRLDDDQIDCLVEAVQEVGGEVTDQGALFDYLSECDIQVSDLVPGG